MIDKRIKKVNLKVAATYVSTPGGCSIIGDGRLNFQVRNGAGCDPPSNPTTKRKKYIVMYLFLFARKSFESLTLLRVKLNVANYNYSR